MTETKIITKPYRYFDTPDGQDTFKKLWCVLKPTIPTAAGIALVDVMCLSFPKGYVNTGFRMAAVSLPIVGIASTFVLATNSLASLRQKDDRLNWFLGGFAAGSCFGLWARRPIVGFSMGMFCGIAGFIRKEIAIQGWEMVPSNARPKRGGATACLADWSLTAERPRNWTTGAE